MTKQQRTAIVTGAARGIGAAVARVAAELGPPLTVLVNAGFGPPGNLVDLSTEQWDRVLGVNLRGPFFATRATAPHMIDAGWGRVVNIASVTANAIAPGYIVSDMTRASARREGVDFAEHQRRVAEIIPVGRVGQPEDVAHTASYLASSGAGFVSGQVVYVAGGPVHRVVLDCG